MRKIDTEDIIGICLDIIGVFLILGTFVIEIVILVILWTKVSPVLAIFLALVFVFIAISVSKNNHKAI